MTNYFKIVKAIAPTDFGAPRALKGYGSDSDRIFRIWNFPTIFRLAPIFSESIVEPIWTEPPIFRKGRVRSVDTDYKLSNRLEATLKFGHHGDSNPGSPAHESVPTKHRVVLKTSKRCQVILAKSCPKVDYFLEPVCHLCQSPHNPKDVLKATRTDRNKTTLSHLFVYYLVPPRGFMADFCIIGGSWLVGNYSNHLVASKSALICMK